MAEAEQKNDEQSKSKESKWISNIAWLLVVAGFIAAGFGCIVVSQKGGFHDLANLANVGSFFQGSVASIWALAGLLFIYETLLAQKKQLQHQEAELQDQRQENNRQEESRKRQDFEAAFFQLLNFQNQIAEQMTDDRRRYGEDVITRGRECFAVWFRDFRMAVSDGTGAEMRIILDKYQAVYAEREGNLGHYFRTVYHVFKFCKESEIPTNELRRYTSLARAQLSSSELLLIFYNGISPMGEKFKPLIEKFGLLEHLNQSSLIHPNHKGHYAQSAYL